MQIFSSCFPSPASLLLWLGEKEAYSLPSPPPARLSSAHTDGILAGNSSVSSRWSLPDLLVVTKVSKAHFVNFNHRKLRAQAKQRTAEQSLLSPCQSSQISGSQLEEECAPGDGECLASSTSDTDYAVLGSGTTTHQTVPCSWLSAPSIFLDKESPQKGCKIQFCDIFEGSWDGSNFRHATS